MENFEITTYMENDEKMFQIRNIKTNLTVSCDEDSLAATLNMMGVE